MVNSSYYAAGACSGLLERSEPFFVLGAHEAPRARELISLAVLSGARAVVVEWRDARNSYQLGCSQLTEGVSYFFVRSLKDTLTRWNAIPVAVEATPLQ